MLSTKISVSNQRSTVVHSDCTSQYLHPHIFLLFFLNTYTITNLWKGITILISEFHTDSSGIATLFRSWGAYLVVIGVKGLQAPLHDMIAIRVLDELQEPRAQRLDNELDLLPCPQALDQLLHCPCPAIELHDHTQFAKKESKFFSISS